MAVVYILTEYHDVANLAQSAPALFQKTIFLALSAF